MTSRIASIAIAATLFLALGATVEADVAPLQTVPAVDVTRYMGRWFEIAKFPNRFQRQCVSDAVAEYRLLGDGRVEVGNHCTLASGETEEVVGVARQIGPKGSPKLQVRFAPAWLSFLPAVWGDYWIVDLADDYSLAAVSEPKREYLWILSRTPAVGAAVYQDLLARLESQGLDTSMLVKTPQSSR